MAYFDLHLHPSLKAFLSAEDPQKKVSCWENLENAIGFVESQSSISQLVDGNVQIAVAAIVPAEQAFATAWLIQDVAPKFSKLSKKFIQNIGAGNYSYEELLQEELKHLLKAAEEAENGKKDRINFINKFSELKEGKTNLILAIEGGFTLQGGNQTPRQNLRGLKEGPHRFLYLTLTHLTYINTSQLCTHAYGMKLINNNAFRPRGLGLTALGKEVVDECYENSNTGKRILIDIRHMSLVSRKQFYTYRKEKGFDSIPIVASHVGVTGISYNQIPEIVEGPAKKDGKFVGVAYNKPKGIGEGPRKDQTYFNPWSINLYDEEITEIIQSDGLIGISLDQRILGFTSRFSTTIGNITKNYSGEYFSEEEYDALFNNQLESTSGQLPEEVDTKDVSEVALEGLEAVNERQHRRYFCNNLLHIIKIGGERAWKHVCIGSDFDGLIDPINSCRTVEEFASLEKALIKDLQEMMAEAKEQDPGLSFHVIDLPKQVRDIMYNNGYRFLEKYFS